MLEHLRGEIARCSVAHSVRVWPEHWHAALVFSAMHTQWRLTVDGRSGRLRHCGLRYDALGPVLAEFADMRHAQPHAVLMRQLRYLEAAALMFVNPP